MSLGMYDAECGMFGFFHVGVTKCRKRFQGRKGGREVHTYYVGGKTPHLFVSKPQIYHVSPANFRTYVDYVFRIYVRA